MSYIDYTKNKLINLENSYGQDTLEVVYISVSDECFNAQILAGLNREYEND